MSYIEVVLYSNSTTKGSVMGESDFFFDLCHFNVDSKLDSL